MKNLILIISALFSLAVCQAHPKDGLKTGANWVIQQKINGSECEAIVFICHDFIGENFVEVPGVYRNGILIKFCADADASFNSSNGVVRCRSPNYRRQG